MTRENRSGERRTRFSEQRMHIFGDEYFDSQFMRALTHETYGGAAVGECLWAANQIRGGSFESWTRAWQELADRVRTMAEKRLISHHGVSAREAFLRAFNYYRCAELLISPGKPVHCEM